ncbi:hypothetical protein EGR_03795 [Echinococcus granulosus]|uniref:Uncharacterized protein n=1 Tax=Echinococcus granulosus TaxID=6210 RepID=W6V502_ECHGR|nr:hypothetical protein EGR_03795 [Echinococcus granulosus]EUB61309.1 hypothetical protein EGR_03795 [Echinococcus granulosus]
MSFVDDALATRYNRAEKLFTELRKHQALITLLSQFYLTLPCTRSPGCPVHLSSNSDLVAQTDSKKTKTYSVNVEFIFGYKQLEAKRKTKDKFVERLCCVLLRNSVHCLTDGGRMDQLPCDEKLPFYGNIHGKRRKGKAGKKPVGTIAKLFACNYFVPHMHNTSKSKNNNTNISKKLDWLYFIILASFESLIPT